MSMWPRNMAWPGHVNFRLSSSCSIWVGGTVEDTVRRCTCYEKVTIDHCPIFHFSHQLR